MDASFLILISPMMIVLSLHLVGETDLCVFFHCMFHLEGQCRVKLEVVKTVRFLLVR